MTIDDRKTRLAELEEELARKRKPGTPKKAASRKAHGLFQKCDNARRVIHRNCGEA